MKVSCFDEKNNELFQIEVSDMPHLGACFYEDKKYYSIIDVKIIGEGKDTINYECVVRSTKEPKR